MKSNPFLKAAPKAAFQNNQAESVLSHPDPQNNQSLSNRNVPLSTHHAVFNEQPIRPVQASANERLMPTHIRMELSPRMPSSQNLMDESQVKTPRTPAISIGIPSPNVIQDFQPSQSKSEESQPISQSLEIVCRMRTRTALSQTPIFLETFMELNSQEVHEKPEKGTPQLSNEQKDLFASEAITRLTYKQIAFKVLRTYDLKTANLDLQKYQALKQMPSEIEARLAEGLDFYCQFTSLSSEQKNAFYQTFITRKTLQKTVTKIMKFYNMNVVAAYYVYCRQINNQLKIPFEMLYDGNFDGISEKQTKVMEHQFHYFILLDKLELLKLIAQRVKHLGKTCNIFGRKGAKKYFDELFDLENYNGFDFEPTAGKSNKSVQILNGLLNYVTQFVINFYQNCSEKEILNSNSFANSLFKDCLKFLEKIHGRFGKFREFQNIEINKNRLVQVKIPQLMIQYQSFDESRKKQKLSLLGTYGDWGRLIGFLFANQSAENDGQQAQNQLLKTLQCLQRIFKIKSEKEWIDAIEEKAESFRKSIQSVQQEHLKCHQEVLEFFILYGLLKKIDLSNKGRIFNEIVWRIVEYRAEYAWIVALVNLSDTNNGKLRIDSKYIMILLDKTISKGNKGMNFNRISSNFQTTLFGTQNVNQIQRKNVFYVYCLRKHLDKIVRQYKLPNLQNKHIIIDIETIFLLTSKKLLQNLFKQRNQITNPQQRMAKLRDGLKKLIESKNGISDLAKKLLEYKSQRLRKVQKIEQVCKLAQKQIEKYKTKYTSFSDLSPDPPLEKETSEYDLIEDKQEIFSKFNQNFLKRLISMVTPPQIHTIKQDAPFKSDFLKQLFKATYLLFSHINLYNIRKDLESIHIVEERQHIIDRIVSYEVQLIEKIMDSYKDKLIQSISSSQGSHLIGLQIQSQKIVFVQYYLNLLSDVSETTYFSQVIHFGADIKSIKNKIKLQLSISFLKNSENLLRNSHQRQTKVQTISTCENSIKSQKKLPSTNLFQSVVQIVTYLFSNFILPTISSASQSRVFPGKVWELLLIIDQSLIQRFSLNSLIADYIVSKNITSMQIQTQNRSVPNERINSEKIQKLFAVFLEYQSCEKQLRQKSLGRLDNVPTFPKQIISTMLTDCLFKQLSSKKMESQYVFKLSSKLANPHMKSFVDSTILKSEYNVDSQKFQNQYFNIIREMWNDVPFEKYLSNLSQSTQQTLQQQRYFDYTSSSNEATQIIEQRRRKDQIDATLFIEKLSFALELTNSFISSHYIKTDNETKRENLIKYIFKGLINVFIPKKLSQLLEILNNQFLHSQQHIQSKIPTYLITPSLIIQLMQYIYIKQYTNMLLYTETQANRFKNSDILQFLDKEQKVIDGICRQLVCLVLELAGNRVVYTDEETNKLLLLTLPILTRYWNGIDFQKIVNFFNVFAQMNWSKQNLESIISNDRTLNKFFPFVRQVFNCWRLTKLKQSYYTQISQEQCLDLKVTFVLNTMEQFLAEVTQCEKVVLKYHVIDKNNSSTKNEMKLIPEMCRQVSKLFELSIRTIQSAHLQAFNGNRGENSARPGQRCSNLDVLLKNLNHIIEIIYQQLLEMLVWKKYTFIDLENTQDYEKLFKQIEGLYQLIEKLSKRNDASQKSQIQLEKQYLIHLHQVLTQATINATRNFENRVSNRTSPFQNRLDFPDNKIYQVSIFQKIQQQRTLGNYESLIHLGQSYTIPNSKCQSLSDFRYNFSNYIKVLSNLPLMQVKLPTGSHQAMIITNFNQINNFLQEFGNFLSSNKNYSILHEDLFPNALPPTLNNLSFGEIKSQFCGLLRNLQLWDDFSNEYPLLAGFNKENNKRSIEGQIVMLGCLKYIGAIASILAKIFQLIDLAQFNVYNQENTKYAAKQRNVRFFCHLMSLKILNSSIMDTFAQQTFYFPTIFEDVNQNNGIVRSFEKNVLNTVLLNLFRVMVQRGFLSNCQMEVPITKLSYQPFIKSKIQQDNVLLRDLLLKKIILVGIASMKREQSKPFNDFNSSEKRNIQKVVNHYKLNMKFWSSMTQNGHRQQIKEEKSSAFYFFQGLSTLELINNILKLIKCLSIQLSESYHIKQIVREDAELSSTILILIKMFFDNLFNQKIIRHLKNQQWEALKLKQETDREHLLKLFRRFKHGFDSQVQMHSLYLLTTENASNQFIKSTIESIININSLQEFFTCSKNYQEEKAWIELCECIMFEGNRQLRGGISRIASNPNTKIITSKFT